MWLLQSIRFQSNLDELPLAGQGADDLPYVSGVVESGDVCFLDSKTHPLRNGPLHDPSTGQPTDPLNRPWSDRLATSEAHGCGHHRVLLGGARAARDHAAVALQRDPRPGGEAGRGQRGALGEVQVREKWRWGWLI